VPADSKTPTTGGRFSLFLSCVAGIPTPYRFPAPPRRFFHSSGDSDMLAIFATYIAL
jgi:hypothetical protein